MLFRSGVRGPRHAHRPGGVTSLGAIPRLARRLLRLVRRRLRRGRPLLRRLGTRYRLGVVSNFDYTPTDEQPPDPAAVEALKAELPTCTSPLPGDAIDWTRA